MIGLILLNAEEIPQPDIVELDHSLGMNNGHCKKSSIWWSCEEGNRGQDTRYHNGGTGYAFEVNFPFNMLMVQ